MSTNRGHRAGQCAPEVPRTRIRARGDLLELHPRPGGSLITHRIPAPWPGSSLIRRRYGGGVGNRCRWAERFASVRAAAQGSSNGDGYIYMNKCSERPHTAAASLQIRPRCARLLAKPEYFSPPNEVCCWQGAPSGRNLLTKAHKNPDFVLGKRGNWHREA